MRERSPPVSIFNALLLYGVLPIILLFLSSFVDWSPYFNFPSGEHVAERANHDRHVNTPNHIIPKIPEVMQDDSSTGGFHAKSEHKGREGGVKSAKKPVPVNKEARRDKRVVDTDRYERRNEPDERKSPPKSRFTDDRNQFINSVDETIRHLRVQFQDNPKDIYKALAYAEALRERDINIHDGGTIQSESIQTFLTAIDLIKEKISGMAVEDLSLDPIGRRLDINDEFYLPFEGRSMQGLLVGAYNSLASQYYMANMFEKTVSAHDEALKLEPDFIPSLLYRADTLVILGKYKDAGADYARVMELDQAHNIVNVFSGIVKVLKVNEDIMDNGWDNVSEKLDELIPLNENKLKSLIATRSNGNADARQIQQAQRLLMQNLKTMHMAMFSYHDHKTKNTTHAWEHLTRAYNFKMAALPPFNAPQEEMKVNAVKQIFKRGFWPVGVGSQSQQPIFVVGFPRSGSTLLERVLDAHPKIAGTGEDSIFNGMLDPIRNAIVQASMQGTGAVQKVVQQYADKVDITTRERWEEIQRSLTDPEKPQIDRPLRFADKMLTNYMNIGFIHMLYPNALILHVAREPMDTVFSAFKHEFPPGTLDYTCEFESLAHLFRGYRDIMDHWDKELPGRVTHVRYEDMVHDMPGMAKAIIAATGLEWDEDVLNFHKKKHAVNTLSTTQVRKGIYKDSLQSWRRYEEHLAPLVQVLGPSYTTHKFETSLASYVHKE